MKKNDVFTFTAPNGVEVVGIVIEKLNQEEAKGHWNAFKWEYLCYAQNRLCIMHNVIKWNRKRYSEGHISYYDEGTLVDITSMELDRVLVDYAILPDYDKLLARYNDLEVAQAETQRGTQLQPATLTT